MNSTISRRKLIKLLSSSLALSSCFKLPVTPDSYAIYWLHLEGAPYRALFDFWPSLTSKIELPGVKTSQHLLQGRKLNLPEAWKQSAPHNSILSNWLSIRGITTQSPHLSQCRREWFSKMEANNSNFIKPERDKSLNELFSIWSKASAQNSMNNYQSIRPFIVDSYSYANTKIKFESISELNSETIALYNTFYSDLISQINSFVHQLKKQQQFDKSVIIITSDRGRAPASLDFPTLIEPVWQGSHLSLISGSIRGPVNIGDIYKAHPKYSEAYPGTWGTPNSFWTPQDVSHLIDDLLTPKQRQQGILTNKENPWISPRPLQGFFVKLPPGKVL